MPVPVRYSCCTSDTETRRSRRYNEIGANHARSFRNKEQTETEKLGFERGQVTALGKFDSLRPLIRSVFTNYICKNPSDSLFFLCPFLRSTSTSYPFAFPLADFQVFKPSICRPSNPPSIHLSIEIPRSNPFKPSAHSPSHHLHTRTSLPADGVQAQPDVVHSTQVAGGQGNVHSAAVAAAAAVAADRTDAACTG
jgi:hypothetical protein